MIPRPLYDDLRTLNAPEAEKLRRKYAIGVSGAKITIAEAERLHAIAGARDLRADVYEGVQATKLDGLRMERHNAQKKARAKRNRKKKR